MRYAIRMESSAGPHLKVFDDSLLEAIRKLRDIVLENGNKEDIIALAKDIDAIGDRIVEVHLDSIMREGYGPD